MDILNDIEKDNRTLDNILDDTLERKQLSDRRDRALLHALVFGILRWRGRLDYIINSFSRTRLNKIDPPVLNILRLGLFQMVYLNRIPVSAAVNTAVDLAKASSPPWVIRYVNAVLRSAARDQKNVRFPDYEQDPVAAIAARKSLPQWLSRRWLEKAGKDKTVQHCDAINLIPPLTLRTNTLKTTRRNLLKELAKEADTLRPTIYAPDGITLLNPNKMIADFPAFNKGWFQVQDEAAQLVTLLLAPRPGDKVLDACAGLGGKTGHTAQLMNDQGSIVALDVYGAKLDRLEKQMQLMGVSIVDTRVHNLNIPPKKETLGTFDRILLDAPCSGLGVLRRNPDTRWKIRETMLKDYAEKQLRLLDNLSHLVNPSGILVYAVCSTEPEENEAVAEKFLNRHLEFIKEDPPANLPKKIGVLLTRDGSLITSPHQHNMDGFYCVRFKRIQ
mgnify:CR=1 FL=1